MEAYTRNELRDIIRESDFPWMYTINDKYIKQETMCFVPEKYYCDYIVNLIYDRYGIWVIKKHSTVMDTNNE